MSLASHIAAALPTLRAEAEARMKRPCAIKPVTGVDSDDLGRDVTTYGAATYEGMCRLRNRGAQVQDSESASSTVTTTRVEVHIPVWASSQSIGSVVFFDGAPAYRITSEAEGDDLTARRYLVERVS